MAEDTEATADPSMEEILASIRKIISDDTPPAEAPPPEPEPVPEPPPEPPAEPEEIIELTEEVPKEEPPPPPAPEPPPPPPAESLVSDPTVSTAASALSSLANTIEIERLSSSANRASLLGNGGRTLEDMVIELMRPLLKEWLDKNLTGVVERLVQKEIDRISRRTQ